MLEDASSSVLARAGAAVVLAKNATVSEETTRLREAAASSALPAFRIAVNRAIDSPDAELVQALATLEAEDTAAAESTSRRAGSPNTREPS